jgi:hypothetical protein
MVLGGRGSATWGVITTVAGDPSRLFGPDQGVVFADDAVSVMAIDSAGRLFYLDGPENSRVRRITLR